MEPRVDAEARHTASTSTDGSTSQVPIRRQPCSRHSSSRHISSGSGTQAPSASSQSHTVTDSPQSSRRSCRCDHHQLQQWEMGICLRMLPSPLARSNLELLTLLPADAFSRQTPQSAPAEVAAARTRTWRWWMPSNLPPQHSSSIAAPLRLPSSHPRSQCSSSQAQSPNQMDNSRPRCSPLAWVMMQQRHHYLQQLCVRPEQHPPTPSPFSQLLRRMLGQQQSRHLRSLSSAARPTRTTMRSCRQA